MLITFVTVCCLDIKKPHKISICTKSIKLISYNQILYCYLYNEHKQPDNLTSKRFFFKQFWEVK